MLGWSDAALHRAVRTGRIRRLRRGAYAAPDSARDPVIQAVAAQQACRGSVVSHRSAALVHGLPLFGPLPDRPDLTVAPRTTGDVAQAHLRRATLRDHDVAVVDGVPVTSVARTLVDLARWCGAETAVVAADYALNHQLVDQDALWDAVDLAKRWPRGQRIAAVLRLVDGRSESPLESVSRLRLAHCEVPTPQLQASLYSRGGQFLGRGDFYWDGGGVIGEADGRAKYVDRDVLMAEKLRQERLEDAGLVVVRWSWADLRTVPLLARRIHRALNRGHRLSESGSPRLWSVVAA